MFEGLKVVELASVLAGPLTGTFFAELGADVLKIENSRTQGDVTRKWKQPQEDQNLQFSAYYAAANYGKESIMLDFKKDSDYAQVIDFIKNADVLIVNFKPGDAKKLKLDYEILKIVNPNMIYAEIVGFNEFNSRPAFDVVLQAETGFMSINGERNALPLKMPIAMIDILAAHQLKEGILCALIMKLKNNTGSKVTVSLYDSAISSLANQAANYLMTDKIPEAIGSEHPNIAPYGDILQTLDSVWIVLAVGTDRQFHDLCCVLGLDSILSDNFFKTNADRVRNRAELKNKLQTVIGQKTFEELEVLFVSNNIPFGRVKNIKEVFETKEARELVLHDFIDGLPAKRVRTRAFRIS